MEHGILYNRGSNEHLTPTASTNDALLRVIVEEECNNIEDTATIYDKWDFLFYLSNFYFLLFVVCCLLFTIKGSTIQMVCLIIVESDCLAAVSA